MELTPDEQDLIYRIREKYAGGARKVKQYADYKGKQFVVENAPEDPTIKDSEKLGDPSMYNLVTGLDGQFKLEKRSKRDTKQLPQTRERILTLLKNPNTWTDDQKKGFEKVQKFYKERDEAIDKAVAKEKKKEKAKSNPFKKEFYEDFAKEFKKDLPVTGEIVGNVLGVIPGLKGVGDKVVQGSKVLGQVLADEPKAEDDPYRFTTQYGVDGEGAGKKTYITVKPKRRPTDSIRWTCPLCNVSVKKTSKTGHLRTTGHRKREQEQKDKEQSMVGGSIQSLPHLDQTIGSGYYADSDSDKEFPEGGITMI